MPVPNYLSICSKYGPAPLLLAMYLVAFWAGLAGFYYLIGIFFIGLVLASYSENILTPMLKRKKINRRQGSFLLSAAQLGCLAFAFGLGAATEMRLSLQAQHNFHILHGSTRSAFAQIVEASR